MIATDFCSVFFNFLSFDRMANGENKFLIESLFSPKQSDDSLGGFALHLSNLFVPMGGCVAFLISFSLSLSAL